MLRSLLFVPGNSPKMMTNCGYFAADAVIFDLEDAVSPDEKDAARLLVKYALEHLDLKQSKPIVRINSLDTPHWEADLRQVVPQRPYAILLPKTNCAADLQTLGEKLTQLEVESGLEAGSIRLIALLETSLGVENAASIAAATPRLLALFLGAEDLTADLRCRRTKEGAEIAYARSRIVMAARSAGIFAIDTPFTDVEDDQGAYADSVLAKGLGFDAKAAISPRHIGLINRAFSPTKAEVDYAHAVLEAIEEGKRQGKGAVALKGKMIDAPIVSRAHQTLAAAEQILAQGGDLA